MSFEQKLPSTDRSILLLRLGVVFLVGLAVFLPNAPADAWWFKGTIKAVFAFLCFAWLYRDAESRKLPYHSVYTAFVVILPELFVPYYLFKTRGFKGGAHALWKMVSFTLIVVLIGAVTQLLLKRQIQL